MDSEGYGTPSTASTEQASAAAIPRPSTQPGDRATALGRASNSGGSALASEPPVDSMSAEEKRGSAADAVTDRDENSLFCFVCTRCEYPICSSTDIVASSVTEGTTEHAFHYNLDCLLDIEDSSVPCYSGDEVVDTSICVSEKLLNASLPPAARLLAVESIIESRKYLQEQRQATIARLQHARGTATHTCSQSANAPADAAATRDGTPTASGSTVGPEHDQRLANSVGGSEAERSSASARTEGEEVASPGSTMRVDSNADNGGDEEEESTTTTQPTRTHPSQDVPDRGTPTVAAALPRVPPLRHYGISSESRIDLVCIKADVLGHGLATSSKDRSAHVPSDIEKQMSHMDQVPAAVMEAACRPPPETKWDSPGNFTVEEAYIMVSRSTISAKGNWFTAYHCTQRAECPDCHLPLGFLFERRDAAAAAANASVQATSGKGDSGGVEYSLYERGARRGGAGEGEGEPRSKKQKTDDGEGVPSTEACLAREPQQLKDATDKRDGNANSRFPDIFIGLELKRIKQREWGLAQFQLRYAKSQKLESFRSLFPEAEELQSLYNRLTALRTQSELYNNLLRKHKEQNDVQSALLQSQKDRMLTYEEKLKTMEQIIDAQRTQLAMQSKQLRHQEELMRSHRHQVSTQQQQIEVEQLLLGEQNKTIESQREQIRLMKAHLSAKYMQERLSEQRMEIERRLKERRDTQLQEEEQEEHQHAVSTQEEESSENALREEEENVPFLEANSASGIARDATSLQREEAGRNASETGYTVASQEGSPRVRALCSSPPAHLRGIYAQRLPVPRTSTRTRQSAAGVTIEAPSLDQRDDDSNSSGDAVPVPSVPTVEQVHRDAFVALQEFKEKRETSEQ